MRRPRCEKLWRKEDGLSDHNLIDRYRCRLECEYGEKLTIDAILVVMCNNTQVMLLVFFDSFKFKLNFRYLMDLTT